MPEPFKVINNTGSASVVEALTDLLEKAKEGEIRAIHCLALDNDNGFGIWSAGSGSVMEAIGCLVTLTHDAVESTRIKR